MIEGTCIPQPIPTRWNSLLRQVETVIDLGQTPLAELVDDESLNLKCNLTFTNKEWEQLEELCNLLSPFAEATDKTQGDRVRQL